MLSKTSRTDFSSVLQLLAVPHCGGGSRDRERSEQPLQGVPFHSPTNGVANLPCENRYLPLLPFFCAFHSTRREKKKPFDKRLLFESSSEFRPLKRPAGWRFRGGRTRMQCVATKKESPREVAIRVAVSVLPATRKCSDITRLLIAGEQA